MFAGKRPWLEFQLNEGAEPKLNVPCTTWKNTRFCHHVVKSAGGSVAKYSAKIVGMIFESTFGP